MASGSRRTRSVPPACSGPERPNAPDRPHRSPPRRSHGEHPARSPDRPTSTTTLLTSHDAVDSERENQRDNDTDRYVLAAQSRQVAGAAERNARARSPSRKPAYPPAFSHTSPCPGSLDATAGPGQSLHGAFSCREKRQLGGPGSKRSPDATIGDVTSESRLRARARDVRR